MNEVATTEQTPTPQLPMVPGGNRMSMIPQSINEAMELAEKLAASKMVPEIYRGKADDVLVAILMGMELGVQPMAALQNIAVINNRPSVWGDLALAICKTHPKWGGIHEEPLLNDKGVCIGYRVVVGRKGEPDVTQSFTQVDAARAGLLDKSGPWKNYTTRMYQMRARGFALRDQFPDALRGIPLAEEAMDMANAIDVTPRDTSERSSTASLRTALGMKDENSKEKPPTLTQVQKAFADAQDGDSLNEALDLAMKLTAPEEKAKAGDSYRAALARLRAAMHGDDEKADERPKPTAQKSGGPSAAEVTKMIMDADTIDKLDTAASLIGGLDDETLRRDLEHEVAERRASMK